MYKNILAKLATVFDTLRAYFRYGVVRARCGLGANHKGVRDENHLLLLAWQFPPMIAGGVYRPLSFARYAAERGWRVTVIAGPPPLVDTDAGHYLRTQLPESVQVIRINTPRLRPSYRFFPHIDGGFSNVIGTLETVLSAQDLLPSIVLASGPPFHNFVSAWYLSRYFNVPLVLDYRDEWTQCPFDFVRSGNFDVAWERRCLEHATSIIVTTRSFEEHAVRMFPEVDPNKYLLIPNGFEPADLEVASVPSGESTKCTVIDIAFLGYLGRHTPPDSFLSTLQKTLECESDLSERLRLRFVGGRDKEVEARVQQGPLRNLVEFVDQVPKPEACRIMRKSRALLILNPLSLNRYIPGKLFDYVAAGSPILVYGSGGEVARVIDELDAGRVVPEGDAVALADAINWIVEAANQVNLQKREAWLAAHHRKSLANQLLDHLESIAVKN